MNATLSPDLDRYFDDHADRIRDELFELLRIPSVSARPEHAGDIRRAADWVADNLRTAGLSAEVHPTDGHPIVLGEWRGAPEGAPTVLIYGHYDVQPAEPLELWDSPPFEPEIRDGRLYARGSVDDKGQLFLHVKALEAYLSTHGSLPVNVLLVAEGEEETSSLHLGPFLREHAEELQCDVVVISDSSMFAPGVPSLLTSLRGIAYFEIEVVGPATDLHSGSYGGAVVNPINTLARILASLHDDNRHVAIPGFYDACTEWPAELRQQVADLPFDEETFRRETGAPKLGGEAGYSTLERLWMRPTCDVHGVIGGYTGEGAKTVLPSKVTAKVSFRLVPEQQPDEIERLFRAHVENVTPDEVVAKITALHGAPAWSAPAKGPAFEAARDALQAAFGREPVLVGEGGSIPVVSDFEEIFGAPVLLMGFGLPGENAHAPNEWIDMDTFRRGLRAVATLWQELGAASD